MGGLPKILLSNGSNVQMSTSTPLHLPHPIAPQEQCPPPPPPSPNPPQIHVLAQMLHLVLPDGNILHFDWPTAPSNQVGRTDQLHAPASHIFSHSGSQAKLLHYVHTAHTQARILTQEYLSTYLVARRSSKAHMRKTELPSTWFSTVPMNKPLSLVRYNYAGALQDAHMFKWQVPHSDISPGQWPHNWTLAHQAKVHRVDTWSACGYKTE